jgi:N6-adenosine-specific RNA methylase IME4
MTLYRCISIDPPWPERGGGKIKRGADRHYKLLNSPHDIIKAIYREPEFNPDPRGAHLWCWTTDTYLEHGLFVMRALGFRYIRQLMWNKDGNIGLGQYLRGTHECCLLGVRGRLGARVRNQRSSFTAPRGDHSEKPSKAYEIIEAVSPGPRLELFARVYRKGWTCRGDELPSKK